MTNILDSNNEPLWTADAVTSAIGGRQHGIPDWTAAGVSIDSRSLHPGDIFIALEGPNFDGHQFVSSALDAGAAAAIVARPVADLPPGAAQIVVKDTEAALVALGQAARDRAAATRIAVTGSVGKTGTKDAIATALALQGPTHATEGNLNNQFGAPLTLSRMPADTTFGVFELGMNHAGELTELSRLVQPHVAVITVIAPAHLEYFASVADIAKAKAEIFAGLEPGGTAILNHDDDMFPVLRDAAKTYRVGNILTFGANSNADIRLLESNQDASGSTVIASISGHKLSYKIGAPGEHWIANSVAVLAAVHAAGADVESAAATLADIALPSGRGQIQRVALGKSDDTNFLIIDDSYNANPVSMRAAFDTLRLTTPEANGRRIAILGDMLELGPQSKALHVSLACGLKQAGTDLVFCAGSDMAALYEALPDNLRGAAATDTAALAPLAAQAIRPGDVVLIKGSLGSRMNIIIDALQGLSPNPGSLR